MAGLTPTGFVAKRLAELKIEVEERLTNRFGAINLNAESIFGQFTGLTADMQADFWARLEQVYLSQYPGSASGINLDRVVSINGVERLSAAPTSVQAVVSGLAGTLLTAGRLVTSVNGAVYQLLSPVTIQASQSVGARVVVSNVVANTVYTLTVGANIFSYNSGPEPTAASILTNLAALTPVSVRTNVIAGIDATALTLEYDSPQAVSVGNRLSITELSVYADFANAVSGASSLPARSLVGIQTPVAGWTRIENRVEGSLGRDNESDTELRLRRARSLRLAGSNTLDAIRSALSQIPGVLAMRVTANSGTTTDSDGTPRQNVWAIVDGGDPAEIAQVLYDKVAAGIGYRGTQVHTVVSPVNNQGFQVRFDRPTNVPFWATVTIQSSVNTPTDIIAQVRAALVAYSNANHGIGETVHYTRLFSPLNAIIGEDAYIFDMRIGTNTNPTGTGNLVPTASQRLSLVPERVQVFVIPPTV